MAALVVVFDFDKTIIDCDSDNWVLDELGATQLFNQLLPTMPWNPLMDKMMKELHSQGTTIDDIVDVLKRTPIHPRIIPTIKSARALGCDLKIVSDANMFFIETILEQHGLREYFSEISTNPSFFDEEGRLRIFPHHDFTKSPHDFTKSPHDCHLCPPNMCKGVVMERIQASLPGEGKKKIIYLGDGSGDFCPSLKLYNGDYVMPRKNFPVWDLIRENPKRIKAEIHEWSDGEELENVLLKLISNTICMEDSNSTNLFSVDFKLESLQVVAHGAFPEALFVPH